MSPECGHARPRLEAVPAVRLARSATAVVTKLARCGMDVYGSHFDCFLFKADVKTSSNCRSELRTCEYPVVVPLRERRARQSGLPGAQEVWSVTTSLQGAAGTYAGAVRASLKATDPSYGTAWQLAPNATFDPFDTLAIRMPFKSTSLLHYCEFRNLVSYAW